MITEIFMSHPLVQNILTKAADKWAHVQKVIAASLYAERNNKYQNSRCFTVFQDPNVTPNCHK